MTHFRPSFLRELMQLSKSAEQEFHGQVKVSQSDGFDMNTFTIEIIPERGLYAHASFLFLITVTDQYPNTAPLVTCLTPVFHPNIEMGRTRDNVCLNIFHYWERHFGIKDLIHALLFLFYEPNFDDPYNLYSTDLPMPSEECIRHTLAGGTINSVRFPPNEAWCRWASENGQWPLTDESVEPSLGEVPNKTAVEQQDIPKCEQSVDQRLSLTDSYFRRSLSGQFTPVMHDTTNASWSPTPTDHRLLPFGFLCHITVETLNREVDPAAPWSNHSRYYFAEPCHTNHAEFLWSATDASIGFHHVEQSGKLSSSEVQRSTVGLWATQRIISSEVHDVEELEQMLTTLLLNAREELSDEQRDVESDGWVRTVSSWYESGTVSAVQGDADSADAIKENVDNERNSDNDYTKLLVTEGSSEKPDVQSAFADQLVEPTSTNLSENGKNMMLSNNNDMLPDALDASHHNGTTAIVNGACDSAQITKPADVHAQSSELVNNIPAALDSSPSQLIPTAIDHNESSDIEQPSPTVGNDIIPVQSPDEPEGNHTEDLSGVINNTTRQGLTIELDPEQYSLLPVELQTLLMEPILDLSFLYPVVERFGSSEWHVHPHQFIRFKQLLHTLGPPAWFLYQTRWPPFLAPGRGTTLTPVDFSLRSEDDIRASSSQMRYDLLHYCRRRHGIHECSLLLVDPLALSPWSPVLNYINVTFPSPTNPNIVCVRSTQWMSFADTLHRLLQLNMNSIPSRLQSFFLTSICLLCNFTSYFSRLELYGTSLGYSRPLRRTAIDHMSSVCLVPATLGCGHCALLDGWLLWAASRGARFLCSIMWSLGTYGNSHSIQSHTRPSIWFPFTDIDEI